MSAVEPSYTHTEREGGGHHVAKRQKGENMRGVRNKVSHKKKNTYTHTHKFSSHLAPLEGLSQNGKTILRK